MYRYYVLVFRKDENSGDEAPWSPPPGSVLGPARVRLALTVASREHATFVHIRFAETCV